MRARLSVVGAAAMLTALAVAWGAPMAAASGAAASAVRIFVQENPSGPAAVDEAVDLSAFAFGNSGPSTDKVALALPTGAPAWETLTPGTAQGTAVFAAARPGRYTVEATALGHTTRVEVAVYGAPAAVTLTPDEPTLAADGASTDSVALTVVDALGTTVAGFDGSVTLSDRMGLLCQGGESAASETVVLNQGAGSAELCAPGAPLPGLDRLSSSALVRAGYPAPRPLATIHYGRAGVTPVRPVLSALNLLPRSAGDRVRIAAKAGSLGPTYVAPGGSVVLALTAVDQSGSPLAADVLARVRLTGPGSLSATAPVTTEEVRLAGQATLAVYADAGAAGTVSVQASAVGAGAKVSPVAYSVDAVRSERSARVRVLVSRAIDDAGIPFNLYDVTVVGPGGQPTPAARGTLEVSDDSASLPSDDPLARLWGRATASVLYASPSQATTDSAYAPLAPGAQLDIPIVDGSAAFALVTGAASSTAPRLVLRDTALDIALHPGYAWSPGQPALAVLSARAGTHGALCGVGACALSAAAGQAVTLAAQVTDAHGNALAEAGLPVLFALRGKGGRFAQAAGRAVWALTDAQGVAVATVMAPAAGAAALEVTAAFDQRVATGGALTIEPPAAP